MLVGPNGSGKTNVLEAVSLLTSGQGLRQAPFADLTRAGADGSWSVFARVNTALGAVDIGTGLAPASLAGTERPRAASYASTARASPGSGALADYVEMVWVTPATDGLFLGSRVRAAPLPRSPHRLLRSRHRTRSGSSSAPWQPQPASRRRRRRSRAPRRARARHGGDRRRHRGGARGGGRGPCCRDRAAPRPRSRLSVPVERGRACRVTIDADLARQRRGRRRGRLHEGRWSRDARARPRRRAHPRWPAPLRPQPSRTGRRRMPARLCSTGEQKALLLGLVLAHAELVKARRRGWRRPSCFSTR